MSTGQVMPKSGAPLTMSIGQVRPAAPLRVYASQKAACSKEGFITSNLATCPGGGNYRGRDENKCDVPDEMRIITCGQVFHKST
eukprot:1158396-Pelagomonas_calceolata.AAC.3